MSSFSSFKRSLRMKKDDLIKCDTCNELDQPFDLICCCSCNKYFHPIKCLNLSEATVTIIRKERQHHLKNSNSSPTSSKLSLSINLENDWYCSKCKTCSICRNSNRPTRLNFNKVDILEVCERCDDAYHRYHKYCAKIQNLDVKNSTNCKNSSNSKKLCLKCSKSTKKLNNKSDKQLEKKLDNKLINKLENNLKPDDDNNNNCIKSARLTRSSKSSFSSDVNSNGNHEFSDTESIILYRLDEDCNSLNTNETSDEDSIYYLNEDSKNSLSISKSTKCKKRSLSDCNHVEKKRKLKHDYDFEEQINLNNEKLTCIVPGCDLKGNLNGKDDTHYTVSNCPLYHNMTFEKCKELFNKRNKFKLSNNLTKSSFLNGTLESKTPKKANKKLNSATKSPVNKDPYSKLIQKRLDDLNQLKNLKDNTDTVNYMREPNLKGLTPIFDYEMFREAQCRAAELIQNDLKQNSIEFNHKLTTHTKKISLSSIQMGNFEMDIWYSSPYPEEFLNLPKLYICEFCLKYFGSPIILERHSVKCLLRHPPGNEIYRKGSISFFEIDGEKNKYYCQNLCLLSKLFLDHKTLYYDVEPFMFYIMTQSDLEGFHIVGYFSKEKNSFLNYNVSCILTLPPYQKQGFGRILIDFSYLLSKVEGKVGSPEKPLSDLGLISYRSYWKSVILEYLNNYHGENISIKDLSQETAINAYDIVSTLQSLGMLKYWKGKHLVLKRKDILDDFKAKMKKKKFYKSIDPNALHWPITK